MGGGLGAAIVGKVGGEEGRLLVRLVCNDKVSSFQLHKLKLAVTAVRVSHVVNRRLQRSPAYLCTSSRDDDGLRRVLVVVVGNTRMVATITQQLVD